MGRRGWHDWCRGGLGENHADDFSGGLSLQADAWGLEGCGCGAVERGGVACGGVAWRKVGRGGVRWSAVHEGEVEWCAVEWRKCAIMCAFSSDCAEKW